MGPEASPFRGSCPIEEFMLEVSPTRVGPETTTGISGLPSPSSSSEPHCGPITKTANANTNIRANDRGTNGIVFFESFRMRIAEDSSRLANGENTISVNARPFYLTDRWDVSDARHSRSSLHRGNACHCSTRCQDSCAIASLSFQALFAALLVRSVFIRELTGLILRPNITAIAAGQRRALL